MKKSTLISTLAMVVIVALALTTATFAWYTANSTVNAKGTTTSAVASGAYLTIGKTVGDAQKTGADAQATISWDEVDELPPAAPTTDLTSVAAAGADVTASEAAAKAAVVALFKTAKVDNKSVFTEDAKDANVMAETFYLYNSGNATITPTVTLKVTDPEDADEDATSVKNLLRVAVFEITSETIEDSGDGNTSETTWTLKKVLALSGDAIYGEIVKGSTFPATKITTATSIQLTAIASTTDSQIGFIAWFDGTMTADYQNITCDFTLEIAGE